MSRENYGSYGYCARNQPRRHSSMERLIRERASVMGRNGDRRHTNSGLQSGRLVSASSTHGKDREASENSQRQIRYGGVTSERCGNRYIPRSLPQERNSDPLHTNDHAHLPPPSGFGGPPCRGKTFEKKSGSISSCHAIAGDDGARCTEHAPTWDNAPTSYSDIAYLLPASECRSC